MKDTRQKLFEFQEEAEGKKDLTAKQFIKYIKQPRPKSPYDVEIKPQRPKWAPRWLPEKTWASLSIEKPRSPIFEVLTSDKTRAAWENICKKHDKESIGFFIYFLCIIVDYSTFFSRKKSLCESKKYAGIRIKIKKLQAEINSLPLLYMRLKEVPNVFESLDFIDSICNNEKIEEDFFKDLFPALVKTIKKRAGHLGRKTFIMRAVSLCAEICFDKPHHKEVAILCTVIIGSVVDFSLVAKHYKEMGQSDTLPMFSSLSAFDYDPQELAKVFMESSIFS